ncbi:MAG: hypothetical protein GQ574_02435 [Crocinitomix sp.]|nr:hypothetical protein [Crocinitomix sp.]
MKEVLDDKFKSKPITNSEVILLDFYFKGKIDLVVAAKIRKGLLKPSRDGSIRSVVGFLIIAIIVGGLGYSRREDDPSAYVALGVGLTFLILVIWTIINAIKSSQFIKTYFEKIDKEFEEDSDYEIFINEDYFGRKDFTAEHQYNWTKNIRIKRIEDVLFIFPWENAIDPIFYISKNAIGDEKFENIVIAVQNKIVRITESKAKGEISDDELFRVH